MKENGYKVALGSRDPKAEEGYFSVKLDVQEKESVLSAFNTLGPVNVVIFNGRIFFPWQVVWNTEIFFLASYAAATVPVLIYSLSFCGRSLQTNCRRHQHLRGWTGSHHSLSRPSPQRPSEGVHRDW